MTEGLEGTTGSEGAASSTGSTPTPPVSSSTLSTAERDNYESRLSALMSQKQKAENQLATLGAQMEQLKKDREQAVLERASDRTRLESEISTLKAQLDQVTTATQSNLNEVTRLKEENATLQREGVKHSFLQKNPDLLPFAAIIPSTTDEAELNRHAEVLRLGRKTQDSQIRDTLVTTTVAPAGATHIPAIQPTGKTIREVFKNKELMSELEFEKALEEAIKMANQMGVG